MSNRKVRRKIDYVYCPNCNLNLGNINNYFSDGSKQITIECTCKMMVEIIKKEDKFEGINEKERIIGEP